MKCKATCQTTGKPCQKPAEFNGYCLVHYKLHVLNANNHKRSEREELHLTLTRLNK